MTEKKDCGFLLKQINDRVEKNANNTLRAQDMTMSQLGALLELSRAPEGQLPLKELEKALYVAQSTMAGIISRLERKGFVEPLEDAADRRIKLARITPSGLELVRAAELHRAEMEEQLFRALTKEERSILYTLLKKVHDSLR